MRILAVSCLLLLSGTAFAQTACPAIVTEGDNPGNNVDLKGSGTIVLTNWQYRDLARNILPVREKDEICDIWQAPCLATYIMCPPGLAVQYRICYIVFPNFLYSEWMDL